ncbi:trehalose operon repressor [Lactiplantibacillus fabifermentans]|uniref:Trehalose operon repressor n=2 Tax=Lactiplantibacillus fabifermentans TaxID=483011 RepID=A0A0R2NKT5_9LACO|nr:trehalose operon repressor [Lactiplantibacillus fabifermentans]ETY75536.1 transcriptional regulator [Lactiplantibacillus fabifermentans T30PCM01]KRO26399.1 transcription regulator [Lactiplantibacillus fabifermentans DSM 21115]
MLNKSALVYDDLMQKIDQEVYELGTYLPSENQLCQLYGISRETGRKALGLLAENGYIQKIRGKGSLVIEHRQYEFPVSGIVSYKELAQKMHVTTENLVYSFESPVALPVQAFASLGGEVKPVPVTAIKRVRIIDGEPDIIDKDYILTSVVPDIPKRAAADSLYAYFEGELGLDIAYATKEITMEPANSEDREQLGLDKGAYMAVVRSVTSLADATAFQYTESRHRADKFRFRDFARRTK